MVRNLRAINQHKKGSLKLIYQIKNNKFNKILMIRILVHLEKFKLQRHNLSLVNTISQDNLAEIKNYNPVKMKTLYN